MPSPSAIALAVVTPTISPPIRPGPRRRGDAVDAPEVATGVGHRLFDRRVEQIHMGARRDLRHHAAIGRVQVELRVDHIGQDLAAPVRASAHHRRRRLVAARLDAEHGERGAISAFRHASFYTVREEIEGGGETVH